MICKMTEGEVLIARGLDLLIRASFSPAEERAKMEHFTKLRDDIGPWLNDYAESVQAHYQPKDGAGEPGSN